MHITLTGDSIPMRRLAHRADPGILGVKALLTSSDAAFSNAEFTLPGRKMVPSATFGGHHVAAPSFALDELSGMGISLISIANNHSLDYSISGLEHLLARLESSSWPFAGAGRSLEAASQPTYLDTARGRIALIALTSSNARLTAAANPRGRDVGRPGTNPLRYRTQYSLQSEEFRSVVRVAEAMGLPGVVDELTSRDIYFTYPDRGLFEARREQGSLWIGSLEFVEGERSEVITTPSERDLDRIERSVEGASLQAEVVVVSMHCHEGLANGWNTDTPATFVEASARRFIDAGAHVISGAGPHMLRGIEIYNGRPIFYSLGNFIFMIDSQTQIPTEDFENVGLPRDAADFYDFRREEDPDYPRGMRRSNPNIWQAVVAECEIENGHVSQIALHPISLGRLRQRWDSGFPMFAEVDESNQILDRLARLSAPYGTDIARKRSGSDQLVGLISP